MKYIQTQAISCKSIQVKEKLTKKALKKFLALHIGKNLNQSIFIKYFQDIKQYEIYSFQSTSLKCYTFVDILGQYALTYYPHNTALFVFENYFALFDHAHFILLKPFEGDFNKEDTLEYLEHLYSIDVDTIKHLDSEQIQTLIKQTPAPKKSLFSHLYTSHHLLTWSLFALFVFGVYSLFVYYNHFHIQKYAQNTPIQNKYESTITHQKQPAFWQLSTQLFDSLAQENIQINHLHYKNKTLYLQLASTNKQRLYMFLDRHKPDASFLSIVYDQSSNRYFLDVSISYS